MKKILIVDDDKNLLKMYGLKFENAGYQVFSMEDAEGDIASKVDLMKPDIISMDIILGSGKRDGFEAIDILKNDNRTKNIPIFILSNQVQKQDLARGKKSNVVDYIKLETMLPSEVIEVFNRYLSNPDNYLSMLDQIS